MRLKKTLCLNLDLCQSCLKRGLKDNLEKDVLLLCQICELLNIFSSFNKKKSITIESMVSGFIKKSVFFNESMLITMVVLFNENRKALLSNGWYLVFQ